MNHPIVCRAFFVVTCLGIGGMLPIRAGSLAHWQFEEGQAGALVSRSSEPVLDRSGHGNHLGVAENFSAPFYFPETSERLALPQGLGRHTSMAFSAYHGLRLRGKTLNTLMPANWTVEVVFKTLVPQSWQILVSKDGNPAQGAPPVALKILGTSGRLEVGIVDGAGVQRFASTPNPLEAGKWYAVAATASPTQLSLWLKKEGEAGYTLQRTIAISGAFFNYAGLDRDWTVGYGPWNDNASHWLDGLIDEIRISDEVLAPEAFLAGPQRQVGADERLPVQILRNPAATGGSGSPFVLELPTSDRPAVAVLEKSSDLSSWQLISSQRQMLVPPSVAAPTLRVLPDETAPFSEARRFYRFRPASNPFFRGADPDFLLEDGTLWIYSTFRAGGGHLYPISSRDLVRWTLHPRAFQFPSSSWVPADKALWAPTVVKNGNHFLLYYSVGPKPASIGVAVGPSPGGPFVDSGKALLQDLGVAGFEAIDPAVYTVPETGVSYLYVGGSSGATLRVFQLSADGLDLASEIAVTTPTMFTEGAFMHRRGATYFLSYSHGNWQNDTYSVHYSTSATPVGPWTYRGKILGSDARHKGPGHHSIFQKPGSDEWFILYHRWNDAVGSGPYSTGRLTAIDRLIHTGADGITPVVMTDSGVGAVSLAP
jgi:hypothetical protein